MNNYYTALCCDHFGKWYKYRNIKKDKTTEFQQYAKQKRNIRYINYYDSKTKQYVNRVYL